MNLDELITNVAGLTYVDDRVPEAVLVELRTFEDIFRVTHALKEQKIVFLDLAFMDFKLAQQVIHFVAGSSYELNYQQNLIGEGVFLFTSGCMQSISSIDS